MAGARKFAVAKDESGKVVAEFMCPATDDGPLSEALRLLTQRLLASGHGEVHFENDVFLMHQFCWCERDDCLWCGGSSCQGNIEGHPHGDACYQSRLKALKRKHGEEKEWGWHVPYGSPGSKAYEADKRALCRELKRRYKWGNECHCTCGADSDWKRRYDACECDWHMGRGRFRFGRAAEAPNFWHKPSGLQVCWYKYIGRDMKVSCGENLTVRELLSGCLASIGQPSLDAALTEYDAACEKDAEDFKKAMEFWASEEGRELTQKMMDSGAVRVMTFGGKDESAESADALDPDAGDSTD